MKRSFIIALLMLTLHTGHALAVEILPGDTVRDVISKFKSEMSILIGNAGEEARASMMLMYNLSDALIGSLEKAFANLLDTTFAKLNDVQRRALSDANRALDRINSDISQQASEVDSAFNQTQELINRIAIWSTAPLVSRYSPPFLEGHSEKNKRPVHITVVGLGLFGAKRHAVLEIMGAKYKAKENLDTRIRFEVPRYHFQPAETYLSTVPASLFVYTRLSSLLPDVGDLNVNPVVYPLSLTVMPRQLGTYTITTKQTVGELRSELYKTLPFSVSSGGGVSADVGGCYDAPEGTPFDTEKSDFTFKYKYGGIGASHHDKIPNLYNVGKINVSLRTDRRICFEVTAAIGCSSRCSARTIATAQLWVKRRREPSPPVTTATIPIHWRSHILPLHDQKSGKAQIIDISILGGQPQPYGLDQERSVGRFLTIEPSPGQSSVFLRPKEID